MCRKEYGCNSKDKEQTPHVRLRTRLIQRSEIHQRARSDQWLIEVGVALGEVPRRQEGAGHGPEDSDLLPLGRLICEERSNGSIPNPRQRPDRIGSHGVKRGRVREVYGQASSWAEEDMRRLAGAGALARAASERRPDLAAAEAMGWVVVPLVLGNGGDLAGSFALGVSFPFSLRAGPVFIRPPVPWATLQAFGPFTCATGPQPAKRRFVCLFRNCLC